MNYISPRSKVSKSVSKMVCVSVGEDDGEATHIRTYGSETRTICGMVLDEADLMDLGKDPRISCEGCFLIWTATRDISVRCFSLNVIQ